MRETSTEPPEIFLFLDESGTSSQDRVTLVGATAFHDVASAEATIAAVHSRVLGDSALWPEGSKRERFSKKGFHFTEDSESVRGQLLSALATLDFRAYAAYASNDRSRGMTELLTGMYGTLLRSVLLRYRDYRVTVVFEQNPSMDKLYGKLWSVLRRSVRGADDARAYLGTKAAPCLAVTDYVLGVTRAGLSDEAREFEKGRFAGLGRNYAYLIDYDDDRHLGGTRHPIV